MLLRNAPLVDLHKDTFENKLPHGRNVHHGHQAKHLDIARTRHWGAVAQRHGGG